MDIEEKRNLQLRKKSNPELFQLYENQLSLKLRSVDSLKEAKRVLKHFHNYLGKRRPSSELATSFLAQYISLKPSTLYRYHSIVNGFMTWYGEKLDTKIRVPQTLPEYIEESEIEALKQALRNKRSHKSLIERNLLLVDVASKTGLRRSELANLNVEDIDFERENLVVRMGKGMKDRTVDLTPTLVESLRLYTKDKSPKEKVFGLTAESISDVIRRAARKADVDLHTHSLRDYFATKLVDTGSDLELVRQLLGHTNLNVTSRYISRTDTQRREAILRLERPLADLIPPKPSDKKMAPDLGRSLYDSHRKKHQRDMLHLVDRWRDELKPDLSDNPVRELGGVGIHWGERKSSAVWRVSRDRSVYLCYPLEISTDLETRWIQIRLNQHVMSSEYAWLLTDQEKGMGGWSVHGGQELVKRLETMRAIDEEVLKATGLPTKERLDNIGPTLSFSDTIWASSIDGVYRNLPYQITHEPLIGLYQIRYGGFLIAHTSTGKEANQYKKWHREFMRSYRKHPLVQESVELKKCRVAVGKAIEEALTEVSMSGYIPGICEYCT